MKNNDIIRPFESSLLVQFGTTGDLRSVSTLRLDQGVTFSRDGNAIEARYHDGAASPVLVERFASDSLASTAFQQLQDAVMRYARRRRWASIGKSIIKWGVGPLILMTLALALNMVATRAVGDNGAAALAAQGGPPLIPLPANLAALQQAGAPAAAPRRAAASPTELARAMADGAKSGKYTVQLSKGGKGTLYVFSDPMCTHCQDLEPELEKLTKDYTIYLFPVSVIGGEASQRYTAKLLCAKPDARVALWKKAVNGEDVQGTVCQDGAAAVAANDQFFRVMRFPGTPAIINAAGEQTPDALPNTASAIGQWMASLNTAQK